MIYLSAVGGQFLIPPEMRLFLGIAILIVGVVATVFVFQLATKLYGVGIGILLGILTLIQLIGIANTPHRKWQGNKNAERKWDHCWIVGG